MSSHSFFSPSKAHMWMVCTAALTQPENQVDGGSSVYADDGTASHYWSALCLQRGCYAEFYLGVDIEINGVIYTMDETRAAFCQVYIDDVRRRAIGGTLFIEYGIDLEWLLGADQGGTMDAGIIVGDHLIGEDLKYGTGEKIFAQYDGKINPQLGLYLLGLLRDARLMGHDPKKITGVIAQPRLNHIDEHTVTVEALEAFGRTAAAAVAETRKSPTFRPGEKQCRWCRVADCKARTAYIQEQSRLDFEDTAPPVLPAAAADLAKLYTVLPMVETWVRSVREEMHKRVNDGLHIIGPDGKPFKFVEGKEGPRAWADLGQAEAALLGQLPKDKVYTAPKVISAPQAAKLLDKKATKQLWKDAFEPLIRKAPGKPILVLGSDPRTPYVGAALETDFEELQSE
jgi:hypothetical protein